MKAILTDIEGTTSSISFVKDVLFPYARRALPAFVQDHGSDPDVQPWLAQVATEIGNDQPAAVIAALQSWIDQDRKHTALKALQGMIWQSGYGDGNFTAHMYPDVAPLLRQWHAQGYPLAVYSSGSVPAQQLFFGHSDAGDLRPLFSNWFDTEIGGKREVDSYRHIAGALGIAPEHIRFLSDVVEELDAARNAGFDTVLIDRLSDYPLPRLGAAAHGHARATLFSEIV